MIQKRFLIICLVLLIQACKSGTTTVGQVVTGTSSIWKNDNIDKEKQGQIKALNDKLFKAIATEDEFTFKSILSDSLITQVGDIDKFFKELSTSLKATSYRILDEYNFQNSTRGMTNTIPPANTGDDSYEASFLSLNREMYVSLLLADRVNNEILIMAVYSKYNANWKLNIMRIGQYSLFGKNAPDYYKLAKEYYNKSDLADAYINATLSDKLLRPINDFFIYQKDKEINQFYDKIRSELNEKFPLPFTLENIKTKPKIFRIYPEMGDDGIYPMVQYLTDLYLKDTVLLKEENQKVQKEIGNLFPGIDQDKKYIFFQAFNELPDEQKPVEHYGFTDQLTK